MCARLRALWKSVFFCVSLLSFRWHPQRNRAFRGRGENNHICPFINHAAVFLRVCVYLWNAPCSKGDNASKTSSHCLSLLVAVCLRAGATSQLRLIYFFHLDQCCDPFIANNVHPQLKEVPHEVSACVNDKTRLFEARPLMTKPLNCAMLGSRHWTHMNMSHFTRTS